MNPAVCDPQRQRLHALLSQFAPREVAIKPGLERITALCQELGHPQRSFPAVHVAGTNGKGSVAALVASALSASGLRVGRYTSPHLERWNERVQVNDQEIPTGRFVALAERLAPLAQRVQATVFELVTAVAWAHFAAEGVDVAVVEVGLGGRFDATNVVRPLVCALTGVGKDHTELLGGTLARIAGEKVGIVKPGVPLVCASLPPSARGVVEGECRARAAPRLEVRPCRRLSASWDGQTFRAPGWGRVRLGLLGTFQAANLAVALGVLEQLEARFPLARTALVAGLEATRWPGRCQRLRRAPTVIVDGAHNEQAARALRATLRRFEPLLAPRARRWLLFGCRRDKDFQAMSAILFPWFERIALVRLRARGALDPAELLPYARDVDPLARCFRGAPAALEHVLARARPRDWLVVTGSLYLVGEVRCRLSKAR